MKTEDMPKFAQLMTMLAENYGKKITEVLTESFWDMLKKFSISDVERGVKNYMSDPGKKWMPTSGDLAEWVEGLGTDRALFAWSKALKAIRGVGAYDSVMFDDVLIHSVIDAMGGWVSLCQMKQDQMLFVGKEFQKYYLAFLREPPEQLLTQVYGIFPNVPPKCIGHVKNTVPALMHHDPSAICFTSEVNEKNEKKEENTGIQKILFLEGESS